MTTTPRDKDIEIPWALVKEFSRTSLASAASPVLHQKLLSYPGRNTPVITENMEYVNSKAKFSTPSRFPSLPASPDLVNPFHHNHQGKRVPYNVLHAYVVGTSPPVSPVNGSFCKRVSPRVTGTKHKEKKSKDTDDNRNPDMKLTPVIQRIKETRRNPTPKLESENCTKHKKKEKLVIEIPQLSPLGYLQNYQQMWSPVEEKKLSDLWNQGAPVNKQKCRSSKDTDKVKDNGATNNHIYKFSKVSSGTVNQYKYRQRAVLTSRSEPPTVSTSPYKYINTWLEAGGDIPNFMKSS